jgi:hypothetical protein
MDSRRGKRGLPRADSGTAQRLPQVDVADLKIAPVSFLRGGRAGALDAVGKRVGRGMASIAPSLREI